MFLQNWNSGIIIAYISIVENALKISIATSELVFGHFKNVSPNETRGENKK
jgi:hypothetical protein